MNLLEHYILEVLEETPSDQFPSFITVRVLVNCLGTLSYITHTTTKAAWEEEKKKGYFLA